MEDRHTDSLKSALRDGVITKEQYEALRIRLQTERAGKAMNLAARRLVWIGLILIGILVVSLSLLYLNLSQRMLFLAPALTATATVSFLFWRDVRRFSLSRGLLGLAIFEATILLVLFREYAGLPPVQVLGFLVPVTLFGTILGLHQNSTWLATPSVFSFYVGFFWSGLWTVVSFDQLLIAVLLISVSIAAGITLMVWGWRTGRLRRLREEYLRRETSLGQLARGHLILFVVFLVLALSVTLPRTGMGFELASLLAGLVPFMVALTVVIYARRTDDAKLLNVATLLLALVAWLFVPFSRNLLVWPLAVLLTAAVLIYLGVRRQPSKRGEEEGPRRPA